MIHDVQDCIYETLAHIEREGVPVEKQLKSLKKARKELTSNTFPENQRSTPNGGQFTQDFPYEQICN